MAVVGGFQAKQVLSVDWPAWTEVGMAARSAVDVRMLSDGRLARAHAREPVPSKVPLNWQRRYSAAEHWFLDEHRLDGVPVLPGVALVGIILEAARDLDLVNTPATVEDITFRVPVRVPRVAAILIGFRPAGEALLVDVWHRPDPEDEDVEAAGWVHSAEARLSSGAADTRPLSDGFSLLQDMEPSVVRPSVTSRASRLSFGPRWNVVDAVWRVSDEETYARLRLPDAFIADLNRHPLHPALLDMAAGLLAYWQPEPFLPFRYRRITVHSALPSELYVYVRVSERGERRIAGDLDLRAQDGTLLAELRGFSMLVTGQSAEPAVNDRGLSPRAGTRILLDLLGRRTPPQILVSSPKSGDAQETDDAPEPVAGDDAFGPLAADTPPPSAAPGGNGVQAGVREIWGAVLGSPVPDDDADFFEIGGDSLAAVEVLDLVRERYGTGLDADAIFDAPTVSEFAGLIERAQPR
jgi:phthiocerol/phenolphthiocerol synthesis type-I polyketide synthase E